MCVSHYARATDHFSPRFSLLPHQVWPLLSSMPHSHSYSYSHLHSLTPSPTPTPTPNLLHAPRSTLHAPPTLVCIVETRPSRDAAVAQRLALHAR